MKLINLLFDYITNNNIILDILVLKEIENIFNYYSLLKLSLLFNIQDNTFQFLYKLSTQKDLYYVYAIFWCTDNYDFYYYYNGSFYTRIRWDFVGFLVIACWAIFFSNFSLWNIFSLVGGECTASYLKIPAVVTGKPLTTPNLIKENSPILDHGSNNSLVTSKHVKEIPQTVLEPTVVVVDSGNP